jgi:hypothetical protein
MIRPDRFERLLARRTPEDLRTLASMRKLAKVMAGKALDDNYEYIVDAMQPIDAEYTENTFREAERVRSQLESGLATQSPGFEFQGSVTSDTHIRVYSDVDLLVLHSAFVTLDSGAANTYPYAGNSFQDLTDLRSAAVTVLKARFPAVTVDDKPGKAVSLSGGSLKRKIDTVIGNWWDTEGYYKDRSQKYRRGVRILDTKAQSTIKNLPFLHNARIDLKDKQTGGLRKVIRLLKTLKYDADPEVPLSSYDIAAIAFNMAEDKLTVSPGGYLTLANNAANELRRFINDSAVRDSLWVPNGMRRVFCDNGATVEGLRDLYLELIEALAAISQGGFTLMKEALAPAEYRWEETRPQSVAKYMY